MKRPTYTTLSMPVKLEIMFCDLTLSIFLVKEFECPVINIDGVQVEVGDEF